MNIKLNSCVVLFIVVATVSASTAAEWIEVYTKQPGSANWIHQKSWLQEPGLPPAAEAAATWVERNIEPGVKVRITKRVIEAAPQSLDEQIAPQPSTSQPGSGTSDGAASSVTVTYDENAAPPDSTATPPRDPAEPGTSIMPLRDYLPIYGVRNDDESSESGDGVLLPLDKIVAFQRIWNDRFELKKKRNDLQEFYESTDDVNASIVTLNDAGKKLEERRTGLESQQIAIQRKQADLTAKITDDLSESELQAIGEQMNTLKKQLNKVQDDKDDLDKDTAAWKKLRRTFDMQYQRARNKNESTIKQANEYNERVKRHGGDLDQPWVKKAVEQLNRSLGGFGSQDSNK